MHDARPAPRGPAPGRWLLVTAVILLGIALYFWFAPSSEAVAPPGGTPAEAEAS